MIGLVIAFPELVTGSLDKASAVNSEDIRIEMPVDPDAEAKEQEQAEAQGEKKEGEEDTEKEAEGKEEDPAAAVLRSLKK
jgi:hypothetical protein